jgi:hypothetical protein
MSETTVARRAFGITECKGFHITFANGWTVSVQFGPGNYGDNYDFWRCHDYRKAKIESGERGSSKAEVWCFRDAFRETWPENPLGYQTPEQVAAIIACAANGDFSALAKSEGK